MAYQDDKITYFAETDSRNKRLPFGIKASDRTRHVYVIGKTGMGKSTLLENMAVQDIKNGEGLAFIDPHGKTADLLLDYIPQERMKDVIYFAPFDLDHPISFNVMEDVGSDRRHLVASGLMSAFKKIWVDAWSARMEYILNNILLALLEYPDSTLIGVNRMLSDKAYRNKVVENISDPSVKSFWTDEFAKYGDRYMQEAGAAIQNKIGQFISNPLVRNIIGQPKSTFDIRKIMDEKKILIINLSKGRVGEANANLLGSMLITKIYLGAMSRADVSPSALKNLPNFYLYVDEFQSFANESFADILSEARKYKLNLTIAHQYIEQMSEEVQAAVFGNVGTMIMFRVGAIDAELLEKEFFPTFTKEDLVNLGFVQIYLKLMIDGVTSAPFSATTLPPIERPIISFKEDIIRYSREAYAQPRNVVEEDIKRWHEPVIAEPRKRDLPPASVGLPQPQPQAQPRPMPSQRPVIAHPTPAPQTASKRESQEMDLRKVISQSYQKNTPPIPRPDPKQTPKKEKGPTPQNMSALRDALASVLKNNQTQTSAQIKPVIHPKKDMPLHMEKKEAPRVEPQPVVSQVKEVPEEVLRRILELD
ncbi:MAG: type IV secretion system DNA-binding domain-containing protein [bacterium]|nr:type IV secretion system DNA-binding domain-containing protein [bacterium]